MYDTSASQAPSGAEGTAGRDGRPASEKATAVKPRKNKHKAKDKRNRHGARHEAAVVTPEEWKARHSKKLSKVHEEVHGRLKDIRTRLAALTVERQPPKQKSKGRRKKKARDRADDGVPSLPCSDGGPKAGKPFFRVHVGEVQHLYKPHRKASRHRRSPHGNAAAAEVLDLHGCTREEALRRLDARLPRWVDAAMRGAYPFVIPAKIVCGGGNQILAGTVETWIRDHAQVANAMKPVSQ